MRGRAARRSVRAEAGALVLAIALVLAGCSDDGAEDGAPSTTRPVTTTSAPTTSTSTTTTPASSTTTEPPPPGPKPVEQLDGLRPYVEGEGCQLLLARLEAPTFPASLRDRFASGYSGYVSAAGVVDVTASSGEDDADFDYYGFITASAGSEVDQSTWFTLLGPAQPPAGTPTFTVAFTRRADGTYRCAPLDRSGGG
ncbi:MAG: hypothetical protein KF703_18390 [Actinobacteria bacterium]|nr:hypothetical protein [Actinomycetota bacterium]